MKGKSTLNIQRERTLFDNNNNFSLLKKIPKFTLFKWNKNAKTKWCWYFWIRLIIWLELLIKFLLFQLFHWKRSFQAEFLFKLFLKEMCMSHWKDLITYIWGRRLSSLKIKVILGFLTNYNSKKLNFTLTLLSELRKVFMKVT